MLEYEIIAKSEKGGKAKLFANAEILAFDASSGRDATLPNPAELLLGALAACILKNVERYSEILHLPYKRAKIKVFGIRNDNPPYMKTVEYKLLIDTEVEPRKLDLWHRNILKFGTITNTLNKALELSGTVDYY